MLRAPRPAAAAAAEPACRGWSPRIWVGFAFAVLVVVIAAIAAWPIYRSWRVRAPRRRRSPRGRRHRGDGVVAALERLARRGGARGRRSSLLGVPLAVPSRLGAPADLLRGLGELAHGALLAMEGPRHRRAAGRVVPQPPGSGTRRLPRRHVRAAAAVWREDRAAYAAVPVALGMASFGLFFGRTTVSAPLRARPGLPLRAGRDGARARRRLARVPAVARVAHARRARPGAAAGGGLQRGARVAPAHARRPPSHGARRRHGRRRAGARGGGRAVRRARRGARGAPLRGRAPRSTCPPR